MLRDTGHADAAFAADAILGQPDAGNADDRCAGRRMAKFQVSSLCIRRQSRYLEAAVKKFRSEGLDKVSVPAVMAAAGLTHGGFYAHFPSKDALFVEAIDAALDDTRELLLQVAQQGDQATPLENILQAYLSPLHRRNPGVGCTFAALGSELSRDAPTVKKVAPDKH